MIQINDIIRGKALYREMVTKDVMESLDIGPLLKGIAKHAGTKRGYDALIGRKIVSSKEGMQLKRQSARHRVSHQLEQLSNQNQLQQQFLLKPTQTWKETTKQWQLIDEATILLKEEVYPPIYDAHSSPWDTQYFVDSDDDEFLFSTLHSNNEDEKWNLETILRAEQVILKLIQTYQWSIDHSDSSILISSIGQNISIDSLQRVYEELEETVKIIYTQQSSMLDPTGSKVSMIFKCFS